MIKLHRQKWFLGLHIYLISPFDYAFNYVIFEVIKECIKIPNGEFIQVPFYYLKPIDLVLIIFGKMLF